MSNFTKPFWKLTPKEKLDRVLWVGIFGFFLIGGVSFVKQFPSNIVVPVLIAYLIILSISILISFLNYKRSLSKNDNQIEQSDNEG